MKNTLRQQLPTSPAEPYGHTGVGITVYQDRPRPWERLRHLLVGLVFAVPLVFVANYLIFRNLTEGIGAYIGLGFLCVWTLVNLRSRSAIYSYDDGTIVMRLNSYGGSKRFSAVSFKPFIKKRMKNGTFILNHSRWLGIKVRPHEAEIWNSRFFADFGLQELNDVRREGLRQRKQRQNHDAEPHEGE